METRRLRLFDGVMRKIDQLERLPLEVFVARAKATEFTGADGKKYFKWPRRSYLPKSTETI